MELNGTAFVISSFALSVPYSVGRIHFTPAAAAASISLICGWTSAMYSSTSRRASCPLRAARKKDEES